MVKEIDRVLKVLSEDHDIIIISASNTFHIGILLQHFGLDQYVTDIFSLHLTRLGYGQFVSMLLKVT